MAMASGNLANSLERLGRFEEAAERHEVHLVLAREIGDLMSESIALGNIGLVHLAQGRWQAARESMEAHLGLARAIGYREGEAIALVNLGALVALLDGPSEGRGMIEASLALIVMAVDGLNAEDLLIWGLLTISIGGIGLVMSTSVEAVEVLSYGDPLTGTANRRAWDATCDAMIERSRRSPMDVSVIFVDVDKFKAVNDQFGHDAGDSVLRRGAEAMRKHLRASDTLARIGGDEFAVMMSDSDHQTALVVAERLLEAFHSATGTTISIGVATAPAGRSTDRIVAAADAQLYEAKASGRAMVRGIELADSSPNVSPAGEPSGALTGELHR